jgi:hypothetical protein
VKSYHSTTVESPATTIDRRDIGAREEDELPCAAW